MLRQRVILWPGATYQRLPVPSTMLCIQHVGVYQCLWVIGEGADPLGVLYRSPGMSC